ncbi:MAG TPA: hypothetical protein VGF97_06555 [Rhizomicrobium sp.]
MADQFDAELARTRHGNGAHRFELRLDRLPARLPPFLVRFVIADTEVELSPSISVATLDEAERLLVGSEYTGQVTGIANGAVTGWAFNRRNPHEQPKVTLRDGDKEVLTLAAGEQATMVMEGGLTANAFRFQLALPGDVLDGRLHAFSVTVGASRRELAGSPVLFGASDVGSIGRSLAAVLDRIEKIERRVDAIKPTWDVVQLEKQMMAKLMEPVDLLLNVHRDSIDRELSVVRRRLVELSLHTPGMEADLIAPAAGEALIEHVSAPLRAEFDALDRLVPIVRVDLGSPTQLVRPHGLEWCASGISVGGSGSLELDAIVPPSVSVVLRGAGAREPAEFGAIVVGFNGSPMSGRFDVDEGGSWAFTGNMIGQPTDSPAGRGLQIDYLSDIANPGGSLTLSDMAIYGAGRAPPHVFQDPPTTVAVDLGAESAHGGWHSVEIGHRGGVCWMGEASEMTVTIRAAGAYRIYIPEVRPLTPEIMPKLQMLVDGEPVAVRVSRLARNQGAYAVHGTCTLPAGAGDTRVLRIFFPNDAVRSPAELGFNEDLRPLTIAVRCIVISADAA